MAKVGKISGADNTVTIFRGEFRPLAEVALEVTRPRIDGVAFQKVGKRARPIRVLTVTDVKTRNDLETLRADLAAMRGTVQEIDDADGKRWSNMVIQELDMRTQAVKSVSGGLNVSPVANYILTARWLLRVTAATTITNTP